MAELVSDDFITSILDEIEKLGDDNASIAEGGKYITFTIASGVFGVFLLKVREIVKIAPLTRVVESANDFRSFIELRDQMIPVYNLRSLLGIETIPFTDRTSIIILETWHNLKLKKLGIIVDTVRKPVTIKEESMVAVPEFLKSMKVNYLLGMAKMSNDVILLLNTDNIKNLV